MKEKYIEKIYSGFLGKLIGIRYGAPIESWPYDAIEKVYGELNDYIVDYKEFAADDDSNGPVFFIRALSDYTHTRELTPEEIGLTWLNYASYEHGFFWWGGYGVSTEHTAYHNLRNGIMAPLSGSIEYNGYSVAEQIGGQIFIDSWGLVNPNNPKLAAEYARKAASVSHDGNGIYGGMFIAACISAAFEDNNIYSVIEKGLAEIPEDCEYTRVVREVINFYENNRDNWRDAYKFVYENFGYDKYQGNCHIIPNSAVMIISLLYGQGDFSKTINICNMCGWDTDCNVANVGTIIGVMNGLQGIDKKWRDPVKDKIVCSSVIGSLNIVDIPTFTFYLADLAYKIANVEPTGKYKDLVLNKCEKYNFALPGSTHGFKLRGKRNLEGVLENIEDSTAKYKHALKVVCKPLGFGDSYDVYQQTYYKPEDLHDNRYDPAFSPIVYPGQTIIASVKGDEFTNNTKVRLFAKDRNSDKKHYGDTMTLSKESYNEIELQIPPLSGACIEEVGIEVISGTTADFVTNLYMEYFNIIGKCHYTLDFSKEHIEVWQYNHKEVSQCTRFKGLWDLDENKKLMGVTSDVAELYTGLYEWKDYSVETKLTPIVGNGHCLNFRVQGAIKSYAVGLFDSNKLILKKNENGYSKLAEVDFSWNYGQSYTIKVEVLQNNFIIYVDGEKKISYTDNKPYEYGEVGVSIQDKGHCKFDYISIQEF